MRTLSALRPVLQALWGHPSLMDATQLLLRAALKDPTNQQFIQLSEACVPPPP